MIPFNKPYSSGTELSFIKEAFERQDMAGNGFFTEKCHSFFHDNFGIENCFLTTSASAALIMSAILANIQPGDEIIVPSFTYVSTASSYALFGGRIVFCDSEEDHPNMSLDHLEELITPKTKVIVAMHYAGVSCDMHGIMNLAEKHNILVVEDAAHCITAKNNRQFLGTLGHLSVLSFHETKNVSCGQGGMLIVNDKKLIARASLIWEKGTNRQAMRNGEVSKYEWVDLGSSFYPSELTAATLYSRLLSIEIIQSNREKIWNRYFKELRLLENNKLLELPLVSSLQKHNSHIFYAVCTSKNERDNLIEYLNISGINAVFHYQALHQSPFIRNKTGSSLNLPNAEKFSNCLIRLPMFADLSEQEHDYIIEKVKSFFIS